MTYPDAFEVLWLVRRGIKDAIGPKAKAFDQWNKRTPQQQGQMVLDLNRQREEKAYARDVGEFREAFPHLFRWIRDNRGEERFAWNGSGAATRVEYDACDKTRWRDRATEIFRAKGGLDRNDQRRLWSEAVQQARKELPQG